MQALDLERLEEFGFSNEQKLELMSSYQMSILKDFEPLLILCDQGNTAELVTKLHAFKGMVSLFAKPSIVELVANIEKNLHAQPVQPVQPLNPIKDTSEKLHQLHIEVQRLHAEVEFHLKSLH